MNKRKIEHEIARIVETQGALRDSIEQTRLLAERADNLLKKHKAPLQTDDHSAD